MGLLENVKSALNLRINMEYPNGSVWIDTCKDHIEKHERIKEYYHEWYRNLVFVECLKCDDCKVYHRRNDKWDLYIKKEIKDKCLKKYDRCWDCDICIYKYEKDRNESIT